MIQVDDLLEQLVADSRFGADWDDVLARADIAAPSGLATRRRRRPLLPLVAAAAALAIVGSALGAAGIGPFAPIKAWLRGTPGKPASPTLFARSGPRTVIRGLRSRGRRSCAN